MAVRLLLNQGRPKLMFCKKNDLRYIKVKGTATKATVNVRVNVSLQRMRRNVRMRGCI